jgi:hypothetical protein
MERTVRRGEPYAQAVTDLWERMGAALIRLERIAEAPPSALTPDVVEELHSLRYTVHSGAELAVGIEPPAGAEPLHEELVSSLAEARDATAEIASVLDEGDVELVDPLLPEWRGALFRVRLARLRALEGTKIDLGSDGSVEPERKAPARERTSVSAIVATVLVVGGAFLFTAGAVLAAWPVWAAGLALFAGGFVLYRP